MKIFGRHNTRSQNERLQRTTAKILIDRNNGAFCISQRLLDLLSIKKLEPAMILLIEDDNGKMGICRTYNENEGIPLFYYKRDTRARFFNSTMVEYFIDKYKLETDSNSYHLIINSVPVQFEDMMVYQVKEIFPFKRQSRTDK